MSCLGVSLAAGPAAADTVASPSAAPSVPAAVAPSTSAAASPSGEAAISASPTAGAAVAEPAIVDTAIVAPATLTTKTVVAARSGSRLAVGDSLMVGASSLMRQHGFAIHAKVGRQFSTAPGIVRGYGAKLPRNVVIELGTNGTVSLSTCRAIVTAAGPGRRVFLVTNRVPRSWEASNNETLRACDRSFSASRVRIVDWYRASTGHAEWFAADGIHTSGSGRAAFARLIDRAVDRYGH